MFGEQQVDDLPAGGLVEVAGRFVGDQDGGIGRQRAGDGDALLLAAGQLRGIVVQPVAKPDRGQFARRMVVCVGAAGQFQRHRDVLQRGHGRDQMERLEDDTDPPAAKA